jgi:hypothetical protein
MREVRPKFAALPPGFPVRKNASKCSHPPGQIEEVYACKHCEAVGYLCKACKQLIGYEPCICEEPPEDEW